MPPRANILLRAMLAIGAIVAAMALLQSVAQWRFNAHLRDAAAHALALSASGATPWHWHFHGTEDVIAGRVFDAASFAFRDGELSATSAGRAFEVGLPLPHPIDLRRFPHLHIAASTDAPGTLRIVSSPSLAAPAHSSAAIALTGGRTAIQIDLSAANCTAKLIAAMLRLRVELPAGKTLHLYEVALDRIDGAQPANLDDTTQVRTIAMDASPAELTALDTRTDARVTPALQLPQSLRVERQRLLLDEIQAAIPAAIVIPHDEVAAAFAQARTFYGTRSDTGGHELACIIAACSFALTLLLARLRPPSGARKRALLEIVLVLAAPLWLIVGGHFTGKPDHIQDSLIAVTALYAISLGWPRYWNWNGSARAWLLACGVIALAAAIGLIAHNWASPLREIGAGHVLRYFGWALLQQYLICVVCTQRWKKITSSTFIATYLGALGFALLHTPNADLMLATFLGGLCWCALFLRERALLPLALSHAVSALLLIALTPPDWLYSAEVSARFFQ